MTIILHIFSLKESWKCEDHNRVYFSGIQRFGGLISILIICPSCESRWLIIFISEKEQKRNCKAQQFYTSSLFTHTLWFFFFPSLSPIFHPTDSSNVYCGKTYNSDITASLPLLVMWKMSHSTNIIRLASCPLVAYTVKVNMVAIIQTVWLVPGKKQSVSCQHTVCYRFITLILSPECHKYDVLL